MREPGQTTEAEYKAPVERRQDVQWQYMASRGRMPSFVWSLLWTGICVVSMWALQRHCATSSIVCALVSAGAVCDGAGCGDAILWNCPLRLLCLHFDGKCCHSRSVVGAIARVVICSKPTRSLLSTERRAKKWGRAEASPHEHD